MNWAYVWGVVGILAFAGMAFAIGWWAGHEHGHKKGFHQGWEDGCNVTENTLRKEFNQDPNPFRTNMLNAQRTAMPRPDSAGPMRVHTARIRGDFRLPENNPDKREPSKPPTPTRMIRPSDPFDE